MTKQATTIQPHPSDPSQNITVHVVSIEVSPLSHAPRSSTILALTWVEWAAKLCSSLNRKSKTWRWKLFSSSEGLVYIGRFRI